MKSLFSTVRLAYSHLLPLFAATLLVAACGRSTLMGDGGVEGCPPGEHMENGVCVPTVDMTGPHVDFSQRNDLTSCGTTEFCHNGLDDNCDGLTDCADPQCAADQACQMCVRQPENCHNGMDDNCNGLTDCQDPACNTDSQCAMCHSVPENCTNGKDDNCDGLVDCKDPQCSMQPVCTTDCRTKPEQCHDGIDNNCDGLTDCADPQCFMDSQCSCKQNKEICNNNVDDNCDGFTDCQDPECSTDPSCFVVGHEICNNGVDDDKNGLTDCADPACTNFPGCQMHMCDPNNPDCADPACATNPKCQDLVCKPTVDFGTLQQHDSSSTKTIDTTGTKDVTTTPCAQGGAGMVVSEFDVASNGTSVELAFQEMGSADHVFALFLAGVNQACNANPIGCYDPQGAASGTRTWALNAGHYYLVVQPFTPQHQGQVVVTLSTPKSTLMEICNNGVDDDMNGLTDCADPACFNNMACIAKECMPDVNLGSIVLGDPPKMTSFDTKAGNSRYKLSCAEGGGGDFAVEFTVPTAEGILMQWDQTGDHMVEIFYMPPNGLSCDALPVGGTTMNACYDPSGRQQDLVAWGAFGAGTYIFIFQALAPGDEGHIDLALSAYGTGTDELCHNGIDDNNNGLTDCADPQCVNDPQCGAPVCRPDVNLGTLPLDGQPASVTLNTVGGQANEVCSCAKGGGLARVVQFSLTTNAGITFQCDEPSGYTILDLFAAQGPRDPCDKLEVNCADPNTLPFGCNFEMPNIQPGTYYLIAEAYTSGQEGVTNLQLGAVSDRALEICNNGIDDDMNGFTDCNDTKCVTSPYCQGKACMPAATIDPMPLDGTPVFRQVQTAGAQLSASPPCETVAGGGDQAIFINMPATGTITVDYSQFGDHVFALYPDLATGLPCDAGQSLSCTASMMMNGSGTFTLPNVAAGNYWLIVAADRPGDEGSVSMKFTAMP